MREFKDQMPLREFIIYKDSISHKYLWNYYASLLRILTGGIGNYILKQKIIYYITLGYRMFKTVAVTVCVFNNANF